LQKKLLEVPRFGRNPLDIRSFLAVQTVQHIRITAVMKNWDCNLFLKWSTMSGKFVCMGISRFKMFQQCLAKLHWRNRCSTVSSAISMQSTQLYDSRNIFLLFKIFLVLGLSFFINSQKKTFRLAKAVPQPFVDVVHLWMTNQFFVESPMGYRAFISSKTSCWSSSEIKLSGVRTYMSLFWYC
jgi:hypothetical protein